MSDKMHRQFLNNNQYDKKYETLNSKLETKYTIYN